MKITVEKDDGEVVTFQGVVDCYLAVRQEVILMKEDTPVHLIESRSYSWGAGLRELAKELYQSWHEIQNVLTRMVDKGA
jgi:hypothetical protein